MDAAAAERASAVCAAEVTLAVRQPCAGGAHALGGASQMYCGCGCPSIWMSLSTRGAQQPTCAPLAYVSPPRGVHPSSSSPSAAAAAAAAVWLYSRPRRIIDATVRSAARATAAAPPGSDSTRLSSK